MKLIMMDLIWYRTLIFGQLLMIFNSNKCKIFSANRSLISIILIKILNGLRITLWWIKRIIFDGKSQKTERRKENSEVNGKR